jgi:OmpA-OmpF porin, OOP family
MRPKHRKHGSATLAAGVLALAAAAGCAPGPNPTLERLNAAYLQAQQDPEIVEYAPEPLREAGATVNRADRVWQEDRDAEEVEHLAYVAEQQLAIARARAEQRSAADEIAETARQLEEDLAQFQARETERGLLLTLSDVLFEVGRADLRPGAQRDLAALAEFLNDHPDRQILVEGHTDSTGSFANNQRLSDLRADAVATELMRLGVAPGRITTRGYGESYPVAPNTTAAGRQQNRRVEVTLLRAGEVASTNLRP